MKENKILKENNLEDLIKKFSKSDIVSSIRENYSKENIKYISNYLISDNNLKIEGLSLKKDELNKWLRSFTKGKK